MTLIYPVLIRLSVAQTRFFPDEIKAGAAVGDCALKGLELTIYDYEGAQAMLGRFFRKTTPTTRAYISMAAVTDRLNKAIVKAATPISQRIRRPMGPEQAQIHERSAEAAADTASEGK